ncbi:M20/M25/M40 family metallo-hydrolase [Botryobacter ruber]|uniref:M20/M25/M40 family metallo-hydrolase n=1 Tax=Botryobacter ruber TaxID=2171629 RepID=UPI000E0B6114|nr:M20/M25/M40 family metallo-hydrolase [Botryobacter ruber]
MKYLLIFLLAVCLPALGFAQGVVLDKEQLLEDVSILSADSMEGRRSGTAGNRKAQAYIARRFRQIGLKSYKPRYRHSFKLQQAPAGAAPGANLVGYIPGKSEKVIVVSAHYDHVGKRNGSIYNGADDNASGVGALLAAAAWFKTHKPAHTLVFVAFDAEEAGLQGAAAFLQHPPFPRQHILLNVNMDMLSINSKGELYASGSYHTPALKPFLQQVAARPHARLVVGHDLPEQGHDDWTEQSDHFQFHRRNIPFVYFGVEDHAHYHKPTDDFANIHPDFYADAAALVIDFIAAIDAQAGNLKHK